MKLHLAGQYAEKYHKGQFRKKNALPYIVHPESVVNLLIKFGVNDEDTLAIAWLHDTLEDTALTYDEIKTIFGKKVADGVYLLTRNVDREEYKKRLEKAPDYVKLVKLCDTLDNITTLECLSNKGKERKVVDCQSFYIPLAQQLCPTLANDMVNCFFNYLLKDIVING